MAEHPDMADAVEVVIESGQKRVFASATSWPGWSRGAKTEPDALATLLDYAIRYAGVMRAAGIPFDAPTDVGDLVVVERVSGGAGTDFGAPSVPAAAEDRPLTPTDADALAGFLKACWVAFDTAAARAVGHDLRRGPRGGGRDLAKIAAHVPEAEEAYLSQLGARPPKMPGADPSTRWPAIRERFLTVLGAIGRGAPIPDPRAVRRPWTPRYAVRRACWHALDHAWELEDRTIP
jgi:hypothetical protein